MLSKLLKKKLSQSPYKEFLASIPPGVLVKTDMLELENSLYAIEKKGDSEWIIHCLDLSGEDVRTERIHTTSDLEVHRKMIDLLGESPVFTYEEMSILRLRDHREIYWDRVFEKMPGEYIGSGTVENMAGSWGSTYSVVRKEDGRYTFYIGADPSDDDWLGEPYVEELDTVSDEKLEDYLDELPLDEPTEEVAKLIREMDPKTTQN